MFHADPFELLGVSQFLSLHAPETETTHHFLNAKTIALLPSEAIVINTARGGLIDSAALVAALRAGKIGGAAIDVLPQEPPLDGNPLQDPSIPNLILTPHIAWSAREARQRCLDEIAANIRDFAGGGRRSRVV